MRNSPLPKKSPAQTHVHIHWILAATLLLLAAIGVFLALTEHRISSPSSLSHAAAPSAEKTDQQTGILPETTPANQPTGIPPSATGTPTLLPSTPQPTRFGVFPLTAGGPLPVPEGILHPTNIARLQINTTLISVYAGSMAQNPQAGILCVLRENLTTGQLTLQIYQSPRADGPLTILAIQQTKLKISDSKSVGYFDLATNTFQW